MRQLLCVIFLTVLLCLAFACQNKAEKAELEKFRAQSKLEEQNGVLIRSVFEGLNKKKAAFYQELYAPAYAWYFPSINPKSLSREEEAEFEKVIWDRFPDINWSIEELIAKDDRVIARFICKGTHKGEFQGIPATGNKIESSGIFIARIENAKVIEVREDFDMLGFMQQLGMELKPKEVKK